MTLGDIGHEDEQGNMFITDRSKDLIKFKGYQVPPAELEDLIIRHKAVDDVAVVGIMNESLASEEPLAYIVVKAGHPEDEGTAKLILDHVKNQTVFYKHLRGGIIFTKEIPKGASGKILKRVLRQQATAEGVRRIGATDKGKSIRDAKL
jgi:acyl-coenzyme A synthetase/AMP-(fatty) acid ligase